MKEKIKSFLSNFQFELITCTACLLLAVRFQAWLFAVTFGIMTILQAFKTIMHEEEKDSYTYHVSYSVIIDGEFGFGSSSVTRKKRIKNDIDLMNLKVDLENDILKKEGLKTSVIILNFIELDE